MNVVTEASVEDIAESIAALSISEALFRLVEIFPDAVTFSSSFSLEDQAISHIILQNQIPVSIFTLDTGRMFPETYSVWERTNEKYQIAIKPYYPSSAAVENFVHLNGPNAFYQSLEMRKACCHVRKVEPLQRALQGQRVWVTGLRAEHSPSRSALTSIEKDAAGGIIKYHPLLNWNTAEVVQFIKENEIPFNALHEKGFVSIGCEPCTRAITPGEDFRAGRWWWEDANKKECGLHAR